VEGDVGRWRDARDRIEKRRLSTVVIVRTISWIWVIQVRELGVEVDVSNWSSISDWLISNNCLAGRANSEVEMAQNSHSNSQNNVNNIITRSSSIRISGGISGNDSEGGLISSWSDSCVSVQSEEINKFGSRLEIVKSRNSSKESGNEIVSGEVGWSN